jgi:hypothetical protein
MTNSGARGFPSTSFLLAPGLAGCYPGSREAELGPEFPTVLPMSIVGPPGSKVRAATLEPCKLLHEPRDLRSVLRHGITARNGQICFVLPVIDRWSAQGASLLRCGQRRLGGIASHGSG